MTTSERAEQYRIALDVNSGLHYCGNGSGRMFDGLNHRYDRIAFWGLYKRPIYTFEPYNLRDVSMTRHWRRVPAHA